MTGASNPEYIAQQEASRLINLLQEDDRSNQVTDPTEEEPVKPIEVRSAGANNKLQQSQQVN